MHLGNTDRIQSITQYHRVKCNLLKQMYDNKNTTQVVRTDRDVDEGSRLWPQHEQLQAMILVEFLLLKDKNTEIDTELMKELFWLNDVYQFDEEVEYFRDIVLDLVYLIWDLITKTRTIEEIEKINQKAFEIKLKIMESEIMFTFLQAFEEIHCGHIFRQEDIEAIPGIKVLNDLFVS